MSNDRIKTYSNCFYTKVYTLWSMHETMFVSYGANGQMYAVTWRGYDLCHNFMECKVALYFK